MKLSEAIILGDTLKKCDPDCWISADGSCGCAFGGALLAAGMHHSRYFSEVANSSCDAVSEIPFVRATWPWLTGKHLLEISELYRKVAKGESAIEDVATYVRSVEPPEKPEPFPVDDEQPEEVRA